MERLKLSSHYSRMCEKSIDYFLNEKEIDIRSKSRKGMTAYYRFFYFHFMIEVMGVLDSGETLKSLANSLGKHHSTVLHGVKRVKNAFETQSKIKQDYDRYKYYMLGQEYVSPEGVSKREFKKIVKENNEKGELIKKLQTKIEELNSRVFNLEIETRDKTTSIDFYKEELKHSKKEAKELYKELMNKI